MKLHLAKILLILLLLLMLFIPSPARAQDTEPPADLPPLAITTTYPSQVIGVGQTVTLNFELRGNIAQVVELQVETLPEGWTATFRGRGQIVRSVYVNPEETVQVELRLEPPANVTPGTYDFTVLARGERARAEFPIELTIQERVPPSLSLEVELPTLRGSVDTTFRYSATLKNEGDEDLTVNLLSEAPDGFLVKFTSAGQDVTSLPLSANESKTISIQAQLLAELPAGSYPIVVTAQGGEVQATLTLTAEVTGQPELSITGPDGRLSGEANAGRESPIAVIVRNNGTAPAFGVELSATAPSGWTVTLEPNEISEIPAGGEVEVTARILPPEKAIAGDYMITLRAQVAEAGTESAEFRITVLTSTIWGVVGIGLIGVAVGVVALAVVRFGRR